MVVQWAASTVDNWVALRVVEKVVMKADKRDVSRVVLMAEVKAGGRVVLLVLSLVVQWAASTVDNWVALRVVEKAVRKADKRATWMVVRWVE